MALISEPKTKKLILRGFRGGHFFIKGKYLASQGYHPFS